MNIASFHLPIVSLEQQINETEEFFAFSRNSASQLMKPRKKSAGSGGVFFFLFFNTKEKSSVPSYMEREELL